MLACAVALAAVSPATAHAVLAGTAALLFELAPFAIATAWLERGLESFAPAHPPAARRLWPAPGLSKAFVLSLAGCGCGGRFGGAVSPAALGLAWAGFGPVAAGGRFVAALVLGILAECSEADDNTASGRASTAHELLSETLPLAAAGVLVAQVLNTQPALAGWWPAGLLAGAAIGLLLPCTAGAIAIAAALRVSLPAASLGVLLTAGILPRGVWAGGAVRYTSTNGTRRRNPERAALMLAGCACALLVLRGGAGFVNPRFVPLIALTALGALVTALLCTRESRSEKLAPSNFAVPAVMFAALTFGSPVPHMLAGETTLDGAFAGERVTFTGTVAHSADATVLVRYAITCCRADASPIALRLDRRLAVADGTWLRATGTLQRGTAGLALHADALERTAAPGDPFVYR